MYACLRAPLKFSVPLSPFPLMIFMHFTSCHYGLQLQLGIKHGNAVSKLPEYLIFSMKHALKESW